MSFDPRLKRTRDDINVFRERNTYDIDEQGSVPYEVSRPDQGGMKGNYCAVLGREEPNMLNRAFFSKKNVDNLLMALRRHVYELSNGKYDIGRQSDNHIVAQMAHVYKIDGKYCGVSDGDPYKMRQEITRLNTIILKWAVKRVMTEVEYHLYYLNLIENQPDYGMGRGMPGGRPVYSTIKKSNMNRDMATDLLESGLKPF